MAKIALLFPGQGAQSVGMGREILSASQSASALFDRASNLLGYDLADVCLNGPVEKLNSTAVSQPAIFTASCAALETLQAEKPETFAAIEAAAGLSLGEYTALVFAGALSFDDGLRLVQQRGLAMQAAADAEAGGMVSILGLNAEQVEALCDQTRQDDVLRLANYLCPGNYAVSGSLAACERIAAAAEAAGAMKVIRLAVAGAFHTPMMVPAADALAKTLAKTTFEHPRISVFSNVDSDTHFSPDDLRQTLLAQLTSPVQWEATMRKMLAEGFDEFYEVGPGRVLRGLMKRIDRKTPVNGVEFV